MKINFITPDISRTGAIRVIIEYANRLSGRGHEVLILYPFLPLNYRHGGNFLKSLRFIRKVLRFVLGQDDLLNKSELFESNDFTVKQIPFINSFFIPNADAIITSFWPIATKIGEFDKSKGEKIYFLQANESSFISAEKWVRKSFELPFHYLSVSNYNRDVIRSKYGVEAEVIQNGINFSVFYNDSKDFNKQTLNISFINNLNPIKKIELIVEAIKKVKQHYNNITFTSFGECRPDNLPDFVNYYKNPDDKTIREIYCNSDIFIMSSKEEACPLSPGEAMACKCAVISTPVGGLVDYAIDNETVLFVEHGNSESIFNGISRLIEDKKFREKISLGGYNYVRENLRWDDAVDKFETFLENIVDLSNKNAENPS